MTLVNRILVIGPSGSGKSTLSLRLKDILDLPLIHLDNIFWNKDRTHISREEFDKRLDTILKEDKWIIDGDYSRTYKVRMERCDSIIYLDFPLEKCLEGVNSRLGKVRRDIPFIDEVFDPEFKTWIYNWFINTRPLLINLLNEYKSSKDIYIFKSRRDVEEFLLTLKQRNNL